MKGHGMKPMGEEAKINRAAAEEPRSGHTAPSPAKKPVGASRKADVQGAMLGQPEDGNPLRHAKHELHSQHPHEYHEHGPHHGTKEHIRHMPLHGMTPSSKYGR